MLLSSYFQQNSFSVCSMSRYYVRDHTCGSAGGQGKVLTFTPSAALEGFASGTFAHLLCTLSLFKSDLNTQPLCQALFAVLRPLQQLF